MAGKHGKRSGKKLSGPSPVMTGPVAGTTAASRPVRRSKKPRSVLRQLAWLIATLAMTPEKQQRAGELPTISNEMRALLKFYRDNPREQCELVKSYNTALLKAEERHEKRSALDARSAEELEAEDARRVIDEFLATLPTSGQDRVPASGAGSVGSDGGSPIAATSPPPATAVAPTGEQPGSLLAVRRARMAEARKVREANMKLRQEREARELQDKLRLEEEAVAAERQAEIDTRAAVAAERELKRLKAEQKVKDAAEKERVVALIAAGDRGEQPDTGGFVWSGRRG